MMVCDGVAKLLVEMWEAEYYEVVESLKLEYYKR
jgi:hypothetical protein